MLKYRFQKFFNKCVKSVKQQGGLRILTESCYMPESFAILKLKLCMI